MSDAVFSDLPSFDEAPPPRESLLELPSLDGEFDAAPSQADMPGLMDLTSFDDAANENPEPFDIMPASDLEPVEFGFDAPADLGDLDAMPAPDLDIMADPAFDAAPLPDLGAEPVEVARPDLEPMLDEPLPMDANMEALAEPAPALEEPSIDMAPEPEAEPKTEPQPDPEPTDTRVEELVVQLTQGLEAFEAQAADHVLSVTQHMARDLFPALSTEFLAHEFAQHLPTILPRMTPGVVITVPSDSQDVIERVVASLPPEQAKQCTVEPGESTSFSIVWPQGGYDFAFDSLFEACRQRLGIQSIDNEDCQDD